MNKKITRRVVLGTLIGGLATGPFVIRSLRKKGEMTDNFAQEWKRELSAIDADIKTIPRKPIEFPAVPALAKSVNFTALLGSYQSLDFPKPFPVSSSRLSSVIPQHFFVRKGSFGLALENGDTVLSGITNENRFISLAGEQKMEAGAWSIDMKRVISADIFPEKKEIIPSGTFINLPGQKILSVGDGWQGTNSFLNTERFMLNYTIDDLVSVNGTNCVKADFNFEVNDTSYLKNDINKQKIATRLQKRGYSQSDAEKIAENLAKELTTEVSKSKSTAEGTVYADITTGQVMRYQLHIATDVSNETQHLLGLYQAQG